MVLFWQEMEQRAAWDSVDPKYPVKQIISLLTRQLLRDVIQYLTNSILTQLPDEINIVTSPNNVHTLSSKQVTRVLNLIRC